MHPKLRQDDLERPPRIAVVLCPSKRPSYSPNKVSPLDSVSVENPFQFRVKDDRHLALYIPVSSPAGFGRAAAWISMNWHLLNHLNDSIMASHSSPRIVWLNLLGDFPTTELVKARFGMETLNKKRKIAPIQYKDMRTSSAEHCICEARFGSRRVYPQWQSARV